MDQTNRFLLSVTLVWGHFIFLITNYSRYPKFYFFWRGPSSFIFVLLLHFLLWGCGCLLETIAQYWTCFSLNVFDLMNWSRELSAWILEIRMDPARIFLILLKTLVKSNSRVVKLIFCLVPLASILLFIPLVHRRPCYACRYSC